MNLPFIFNSGYVAKGINLYETTILDLGTSIFKRPRAEIELFYEELERDPVLLNESRVIFVGEGGVGKSTIINRITSGEYDKDLSETRGVLIKKWETGQEREQPSPRVAFWDFGGQAVMHSMHEFFLGSRCLYVVVLDGRRDEKPEYWLDIIRQYGSNSSVIVIMNKIDQNETAELSSNRLMREYDSVFKSITFHRVSCKTGAGMADFIEELKVKVKETESCKKVFPGRWFRIKEKLSDMKDGRGKPQNYIREDAFIKICEDEGITDAMPQATLLKWFNDLGVCFSYKSSGYSGAVDELKVLRPEWIMNGVYKLITSGEAVAQNGFISHAAIKRILAKEDDVNPAYRNTEKDFILGMMRDFKLSYQVESHEFIPMLTTDNEPLLDGFKGEIHFQIQFEVPVPAFILYNFIVQMRDDVDRRRTWKRGTFLQSPYRDNQAVVRFGKDRNVIDIFVSGGNGAEYLSHLRRVLASALGNMTVKQEEFIEYERNGKKTLLKLERLLKMFRDGRDEDYSEDLDGGYKILDALSVVAPGEIIQRLIKIRDEKEDEINRYKARENDLSEMKSLLLNINDNTKDLPSMVSNINENTKDLPRMILNIEALLDKAELTDAAVNGIVEILKGLERETIEPELKRKIDELCGVASSPRSFKAKLVEVLGVAGSVASIASVVDFPAAFQRILSLLSSLPK